MISLKGISKEFQTEDVITRAVDSIDLEITKGDFLSIMGPSGCGKSTLLNILGLLDQPTVGEYKFDGVDAIGMSQKALAKIRNKNLGFVFQSFNLIDEISIYENIELPLLYQGVAKREREQRVQATMKRMNIEHRAKHYPNQLSGGQQQRVAIARAVVVEPKLILADEPTGNLDSKNGIQVMELLSELNKEGATIIMVTHSDRDAEYANRRIELSDGKISDLREVYGSKVA